MPHSTVGPQAGLSGTHRTGNAAALKLDASFDAARALLAAAGLRTTLPRLRVMRLFLERPGEPMSAEFALRALLLGGDAMSLSSVYTILKRLAAAGLVSCHFAEGRRLFVREPSPGHGRAQCSACDWRWVADDRRIDSLFAQLANDWHMPLSGFSVTLYGRCPSCGTCAVTREWMLDGGMLPSRSVAD